MSQMSVVFLSYDLRNELFAAYKFVEDNNDVFILHLFRHCARCQGQLLRGVLLIRFRRFRIWMRTGGRANGEGEVIKKEKKKERMNGLVERQRGKRVG